MKRVDTCKFSFVSTKYMHMINQSPTCSQKLVYLICHALVVSHMWCDEPYPFSCQNLPSVLLYHMDEKVCITFAKVKARIGKSLLILGKDNSSPQDDSKDP